MNIADPKKSYHTFDHLCKSKHPNILELSRSILLLCIFQTFDFFCCQGHNTLESPNFDCLKPDSQELLDKKNDIMVNVTVLKVVEFHSEAGKCN